MFNNVSLQDDGHYICSAKNKVGMDIKVIHIQVTAKPEKHHIAPTIVAPSEVESNYFTQASLTCNVTGFPYPSIKWKHNGVIVQSSGSTLIIQNVTNVTAGVYTCIATNDVGTSQASIELKYLYDAPNIVTSPLPSMSFAGQSHNYSCIATGHPSPSIDWSFSSFTQDNNFPPHVITQNGSLLTFVKMQKSGQLTCTATNQFGMARATVHVIVKSQNVVVG